MQSAPDFTDTPERPFCGEFIICGLLPGNDRSVRLILAQMDHEDRMVYKGLVPLSLDHPDFPLIRSLPPHPERPLFQVKGLAKAIWSDPDWTCSVSYTGIDAHGRPENPIFLGMGETDGWLCYEPEGDHQG